MAGSPRSDDKLSVGLAPSCISAGLPPAASSAGFSLCCSFSEFLLYKAPRQTNKTFHNVTLDCGRASLTSFYLVSVESLYPDKVLFWIMILGLHTVFCRNTILPVTLPSLSFSLMSSCLLSPGLEMTASGPQLLCSGEGSASSSPFHLPARELLVLCTLSHLPFVPIDQNRNTWLSWLKENQERRYVVKFQTGNNSVGGQSYL